MSEGVAVQRLGPDAHRRRRRHGLRLVRVLRRQLRRRAAPDRCRRRGRPGPPAHRRQRLRAAPEPGHDHRRPAVVRVRRDHDAGPRRQRAHPPASATRDRPPADDHDGMREPGRQRASRTAARGQRGDPGGVRRRRRWPRAAARRAGPRPRRGALRAAPAAGHRGRRAGRRLPDPPPAAADDLLLGGRGQVLGPDGWRPPITFGGTDATLEEVVAGRRRRRGACWPPRPTGGWSGPCAGARDSADGSAPTWPTTTAP